MHMLLSVLISVCVLLSASLASAASQQVKLTWNDLPNESNYKVERRSCGSGAYVPLGTTLANVVTYTDPNLPQGTNYGYRVLGSNALGDGTPSDELCVSTAGIPGKVGGLNAVIEIVP